MKKQSSFKVVESEEEMGCVPACMATALGKTYKEVSADFWNDFNTEGMSLESAIEYLGQNGCSIIHKHIMNYGNIKFGRDELLKPFAPIHIVRMEQKFDSPNGHVVVMDAEGKLHCPNGMQEEDIKNAYAITDVIGIFKEA